MALVAFCAFFSASGSSFAQVPGPADVGRIQSERQEPKFDREIDKPLPKEEPQGQVSATGAPPGSEKIFFDLKSITLEGVTAFPPQIIAKLYIDDIGKNIPLSRMWEIAQSITKYYADRGYFLSYAFVPAQKIGSGEVKIVVVEGYVNDVVLDEPQFAEKRIYKSLKKRILSRKPLRLSDLEGFLLRLNNLPGYSFRSVLAPSPDQLGTVTINLVRIADDTSQGVVSFDNNNSRFLGPHQVSVSYKDVYIPMQATTVSFSSAPRFDLVYNLVVDHQIPIASDWDLRMNVALSYGRPGYTIKPQQIKSGSKNYVLSLNYKPIVSRNNNLGMRFDFDARDTDSNTLGTALVRESIRSLRVGMSYEGYTPSGRAFNSASVTLSQGLDILSASNRGQLNLSRGKARPDYSKLELSYTNVFFIGNKWQLTTDARMQRAPQPLHSSEQFGYGGSVIGRAYDSSEILGDNGVSGSVEIKYYGIPSGGGWSTVPYVFYDIGRIWNAGEDQPAPQSGASAGGGIRFFHQKGISTHVGLALPLTRPIGTPIYGGDDNAPRLLLQMSSQF